MERLGRDATDEVIEEIESRFARIPSLPGYDEDELRVDVSLEANRAVMMARFLGVGLDLGRPEARFILIRPSIDATATRRSSTSQVSTMAARSSAPPTDTNPHGNEVFDAQIAAVCLEHGATTVLTNDARFRQFAGITVQRLQ